MSGFYFYIYFSIKDDVKYISKDLDYWLNKIDESITPVSRKKEINYPLVDYSFLRFLVGVIDGDGYIHSRKKLNGYIEFNLVITFNNRDLTLWRYYK